MPTSLSDFAKDYWPTLVSGLAGTAVGAGAGYVGTNQRPEESSEDFAVRRRANAGTGAIAGAAVGAGAPTLLGLARSLGTGAKTGPIGKLVSHVPYEGAIGAVGGAGVGATVGAGKEQFSRAGGAKAEFLKGEGDLLASKANAAGAAQKSWVDHVAALKAKMEGLAPPKGAPAPAASPDYIVAKNDYLNAVDLQAHPQSGVSSTFDATRAATADATAAQHRLNFINDQFKTDASRSVWRKFFGTPEEKALMSDAIKAPPAAFAGRRYSRIGALLGLLTGAGAHYAIE